MRGRAFRRCGRAAPQASQSRAFRQRPIPHRKRRPNRALRCDILYGLGDPPEAACRPDPCSGRSRRRALRRAEHADDPGLNLACFERDQLRRGLLADSQGMRGGLRDPQCRCRTRPWPRDGSCERYTVLIAADPLDDSDFRQGGGNRAAVSAAADRPGTLDIAKHAAQPRAIARADAKGASNLALADRDRAVADKGEQFGPGRQFRAFRAGSHLRAERSNAVEGESN